MTLSEEDLAQISAFYDEELEPEEAAQIKARLEVEPELAKALAGVREVSEALKLLRPVYEPIKSPKTTPPVYSKFVIAACLALAIATGAVFSGNLTKTPITTLEWHRYFLAQTYETDGELKPSPATQWIGNEPDLTSANLILVDAAQEGSGEVFLHYSGVNGCRLTFGTHQTEPVIPTSVSGLLGDSWSTAELHFSLLAVGMDADKFRAITELLKEETQRDQPAEQLLAAVRDTTKHAVPCV